MCVCVIPFVVISHVGFLFVFSVYKETFIKYIEDGNILPQHRVGEGFKEDSRPLSSDVQLMEWLLLLCLPPPYSWLV